MKTVGFGYFHRTKKKKNYRIICVTNFFKRAFTICLFLLLVLVLNLFKDGTVADFKTSIFNFVDGMKFALLFLGF